MGSHTCCGGSGQAEKNERAKQREKERQEKAREEAARKAREDAKHKEEEEKGDAMRKKRKRSNGDVRKGAMTREDEMIGIVAVAVIRIVIGRTRVTTHMSVTMTATVTEIAATMEKMTEIVIVAIATIYLIIRAVSMRKIGEAVDTN